MTARRRGIKIMQPAWMKIRKRVKKARLELEQKTGRSVIIGENFLPPASPKLKLEHGKPKGGNE